MKATTQKTLQYYKSFASKYKGHIFATLLSNAVGTILGFVLLPLIIKYFFDTMIEFSGTDKNEVYEKLILFWGLIAIVDIVAFTIVGRINDFLFTNLLTAMMRDSMNYCFQHIHKHSYSFFTNQFVGGLVSKVQRFTNSFGYLADMIQWDFFPQIIMFTISIGIIWFFAPILGIIVTVWMILFFVVIFWATKKWKIPYSLEFAKQKTQNTGLLADGISNATAIKMFAHQQFETQSYKESTYNLIQKMRRSWYTSNYINIFQACFMSVLEIVVWYVIIQLWMADQITVGTMVLVQGYLLSIYMRLWGFGKLIRGLYDSMTESQEMTDILETTPAVQDTESPEECRIGKGDIKFKNLSFAYEEKTEVFENFDFHIPSGKKIGLVGESGAGKTTITKLLLRFSEPQKGDILIDGQSIYTIVQEDLRRNISFVPQEPVLFHRSLLDNIRYGDLDATDEEIYEVAKKAHAHDFILNTPEGYETLVGERGVKLSGGERQRIAIARAMLKKAPILILDEATSSLDSKSEKHIQEALHVLMKGKTTIVIAHRLSTLKEMDEICVIEDGQILERGSHNELLEKNGKYSELWKHQSGGFIG